MPKGAKGRRERHREELRAELLAAAHQLVKEGGYDALTIRKLADRVGYAPMSVYSYFADKQAILFALAEDAFGELARRMERRTADDPVEALRLVMMEYAAFGLENPNEYRTVFMTQEKELPAGTTIAELEHTNPALQVLLNRVAACVAAGRLKGDVRAISTVIWTVGHGAVTLLITFPFYPFGEPADYVRRIGDLTLAALAEHEIAPLAAPTAGC